jgi:hypothetical protein
MSIFSKLKKPKKIKRGKRVKSTVKKSFFSTLKRRK